MKNAKLTITIFLFLVLSLNVFAAGNTITGTITSQSSSLPANYPYTINFYLTDTTNLTANVTALFYVNGANVVNTTWVNNLTQNVTSLNTFSTTFAETLYGFGDTVYTNITFKEAGNNSVTGSVRSNNLVLSKTSTMLVSPDILSFMPGLLGDLGTGLGSLIAALLPWVIVLAIIGAVLVLFYLIFKDVSFMVGSYRRK